MRATFAFLADRETYNLVRSIAWKAHCELETGLDVTRLEPHVSLKQPFQVTDFSRLAAFMPELAAIIPPFEIHLTDVQAIPTVIGTMETGILWLAVEQTQLLKEHHHHLNRGLNTRFGPTPAQHDGEDYHFHMTIAIGQQPWKVYQQAAQLFRPSWTNYRFRTSQLAMFVYEADARLDRGYMTYKVLPLGST